MSHLIKNELLDDTTIDLEPASKESIAADVQSYLISNYRDALKKGDKSAAKSCLLAARHFAVDDPKITSELYTMSKADGDINEASKCFVSMFNDLFHKPSGKENPKFSSDELLPVINQTKEETRILLSELKSHSLNLKSPSQASESLASNETPKSTDPSSIKSSENRIEIHKDLPAKVDDRKNSTMRSAFYIQLFDSLPEDVKKSILDHSIETSDNQFDQCKLIMLTLSIFKDSFTTYGTRLLKTLVDLSEQTNESTDETGEGKNSSPNNPSLTMRRYAKSLLVLDAIPLTLNIATLSSLEIDAKELFERTLNFYSDYCLEALAVEVQPSDMHDEVKKSIANRILGIEFKSTTEDTIERHLKASLSALSHKVIDAETDEEIKNKYSELVTIIADESDQNSKFDRMMEIIGSLNIEDDIPDDILHASSREESKVTVSPPPAPKGRGRPKKIQQSVIVSLDEGMKKHLQDKFRKVHFVFVSILQHMFSSFASYLKSTRSRVLIDFNNPLAASIELELAKSTTTQRSSRSKTGSQQSTNELNTNPTKKFKADSESNLSDTSIISNNQDESPLNSEQCKIMDLRTLTTLNEALKCSDFLESNYGVITKLWHKFSASNKTTSFKWYKRFLVDSKLMSGNYEGAFELLEDTSSETSNNELRQLVQLISCHIQKIDKTNAFLRIDDLVSRMKQDGLIVDDESYLSGNMINEYKVTVRHNEKNNLGFLFFDSLSMIRYCISILMDILKQYVASTSAVSDNAIGHAIVLSQFDWPIESQIYDQCISWIRTHKTKSNKFTYTEFFRYIRNPNIIEDFMAMLSQGYTLDINSCSDSLTQSKTGGQSKAITTRGVNKTFKEDLKIAMVAQMRRSAYLTSVEMISEFIHDQIQNLAVIV